MSALRSVYGRWGIADQALRHSIVFALGFKRRSHFLGAHESPMNIFIFRAGIEHNQPVAVLAVRLEPVADLLRPLAEYLRALRAFDSYFFVHREMLLNSINTIQCRYSAFHRLRAC